ncbi:MAG: magnesium/cobalt transporter CorA [Parachlamydiaceae bacterium]
MLSKLLKSRIKTVGLPPGSLVPFDDEEVSKAHISLFDYDANSFVEKQDASIQECLACLETNKMTWINVSGINNIHTLEVLGRRFGLHPLLLEDIMSAGQRSKLDDYKDTLYLVIRQLTYNNEKQMVEDEQVSLVLGKNFLITFLESKSNIFAPVCERLRSPKSRVRQREIDYLCYTLIDCLVDNYFLILEKVDGKLENLEEELIKSPTPQTLQQIQHAKREITLLRKSVWPMREVISNLRRIDSPLVQDATKFYIQDVYDHTIQAIDTIESFRDITSGMLDIYLSNISQRMNEIMKVLTVVATIFVPLTFIASIYGMNFENIPELHSEYGYYGVLALMGGVSIMMLTYFRRKGWI